MNPSPVYLHPQVLKEDLYLRAVGGCGTIQDDAQQEAMISGAVSFAVRPLGQSDMSVKHPHRYGLLCWGLSVLLIQSISSHPAIKHCRKRQPDKRIHQWPLVRKLEDFNASPCTSLLFSSTHSPLMGTLLLGD
ncbi:hypothetical protein Baya_2536 [Bagarius yarrelli]|uniref:Uncharacterized protein n=1 Tax=Bagarius yarrelli TaxID=175774 RepID=A0A556VXU7_BAGYA|nr:hypothetical protein Baya_2536 [Bagarius yarrelli]